MFCRIAILIFLSFSSLNNIQAQDIHGIDAAIKKFIATPGLEDATTGFCLSDPESGKVLYYFNDSMAMAPASCLKIVTTGASLGLLGQNHRFFTILGYDGIIDKKGILYGDIIIKGGGDPMLGSDRIDEEHRFGFEALDKSLAKAGIKSVKGRLIVDCSYFDNENVCRTWGYDDIGSYFGAGCYGLNFMDNTYAIELQAGLKPGEPVKLVRVMPDNIPLAFENRLVTGPSHSGDQSNIFGEPEENCRVLQGSIQLSKKQFSIKGSLPDPPGYLARTFAKQLFKEKIIDSVSAFQVYTCAIPRVYNHFKCIDTISSPGLADIVYYTNSRSVNLYAECLMKETGLVANGAGSRISGAETIKKYWSEKGVDTSWITMEDGSGLSRNDRISAAQLNHILGVIKKESYFDVFLKSLPVSGESGPMKGMGSGTKIQGRIYCKTGHLSGVRAYSGYVKTASGKWLCFSFIVNHYNLSDWQIHDEIEKVLESLGNM